MQLREQEINNISKSQLQLQKISLKTRTVNGKRKGKTKGGGSLSNFPFVG